MNGVRRFLGAATASPPPAPEDAPVVPPLVPRNGPSWPPNNAGSPDSSPYTSPKMNTAALFLRKDKQKAPPPPPLPNDDDSPGSSARTSGVSSMMTSQGQTSATSSPSRPSMSLSKSTPIPGSSRPEWKRSSTLVNLRDELLVSLLASEAAIDSRDFEILSSEEVEDLKKEEHVLASRLVAANKKVALETKIRDAAISLSKVNSSHRKVSKQTEEQLGAANRRVETAQKELWRVSERANEVHRRLLEHRAGVLSLSVRSLEKKNAPPPPNNDAAGHDSGYDTPMSPVSASTSSARTHAAARFDGAHLFAGHADAVVPKRKSPSGGADEIEALEQKLKVATEALAAAGKKQAEMARELSIMRLEKETVEFELQGAGDTIANLEEELPKVEEEIQGLMREREGWDEERAQWQAKLQEATARAQDADTRLQEMEGLLADSEGRIRDADEQLRATQERLRDSEDHLRDRERRLQDAEITSRNQGESESAEAARLRQELQAERDRLNLGIDTARALIDGHGIKLGVSARGGESLERYLDALGIHLETIAAASASTERERQEWEETRRRLEDEVRSAYERREGLVREVEEARREREEARRDARDLEIKTPALSIPLPPLVELPPLPEGPVEYVGEAAHFAKVLQPLWAILPSPEARATQFSRNGGSPRAFRAASSANGSPAPVASLSELDVRSLKSLYDASPSRSPNVNTSAQQFTVEAFAHRVQSLISDDRALIERLVRFAKAHELLKRNAERAQKLAQEGSSALETYQKQVIHLEDRNRDLNNRLAGMSQELGELQDAVDRITQEKAEIEMQAAEQAQTMDQLQETNNTLSAKTLSLAEEVVAAPEGVKRQLDDAKKQLASVQQQLAEVQRSYADSKAAEDDRDELERVRNGEQMQKALLLDELNDLQMQNGQLREQIRAIKK
uniref:Up-regulated during septation protein 1 domain-containing protein n=1 Tax=Schizophyllum commune (strain H4-8 / FGSC 9210) TaxID=578458 RepID=D8PQL7_SCHCM